MKRKTKQPIDDWNKLINLIGLYRDAAVHASWSGGGDPSNVEVLELRLKITALELNNHIARMKADLI